MSDELNTMGLDKLLKMLKGKLPTIKVGIFGDTRNATIGAYHEFGTSKMPRRSFLREPIAENLMPALENSGAFDESVLKEVMAEGTIEPWLKKVATLAEGVVMDAFDTGGNGKWAATKPGYENNTGMILVDTQQLRNSVTAVIK